MDSLRRWSAGLHILRRYVGIPYSSQDASKGDYCCCTLGRYFSPHVLDAALLPIIEEYYPTHHHHHFQQDNNPKHTSRWAHNYFQENHINWWKTPAQTSTLLKMSGGQMKNYLQSIVKPKNTHKLRMGIKEFSKMTPEMCKRYVRHLWKVIPKVNRCS